MDKIYREYKKVQHRNHGSRSGSGESNLEPLNDLFSPPATLSTSNQAMSSRKERKLNGDEKKYLLAVERGDIATVKCFLSEAANFEQFNINSVDPLGRSALHIAIEYENIEMIDTLLSHHVEVGEALLHAINEEFVEAVEMLLHYQDHGVTYNEVSATSDLETPTTKTMSKRCKPVRKLPMRISFFRPFFAFVQITLNMLVILYLFIFGDRPTTFRLVIS